MCDAAQVSSYPNVDLLYEMIQARELQQTRKHKIPATLFEIELLLDFKLC